MRAPDDLLPPEEDPAALAERTATEWFFRRDRGLAPHEAEAFQRWLGADARHPQIFAEIEETWRALAETEERVTGSVAAKDSGCVGASRNRGRKVLLWATGALAAAAAIALTWRSVAPRLREASAFADQATTEAGGFRRLDLPDGSFVTLNSESTVEVQFTAAERHVFLRRGEAHFVVAKNPRRPFVVEANAVAVKAVGTAFDVRLGAETVEVLVTEGKVRVDDTTHGETLLAQPIHAEPLLMAGERVAIPVAAAPQRAVAAAVSPQEMAQALAWQNRRLEYVDAPLAEIVADFNRHNQRLHGYSEHTIVIADRALAARRFGGTFPAGDYNSLVQVLEESFGVVVERREHETVLRLP